VLLLPSLLRADATIPPAAGDAALRISRTRPIADRLRNRELEIVFERYRRAMEARDVTALLALASARYHEDNGTPSTLDDYGYDGLREILERRFALAKQVRVLLTYRRVRIKGTHATVQVQAEMEFELSNNTLNHVSEVQMELEREPSGWLFTRGM
jgi:hypothetical protein